MMAESPVASIARAHAQFAARAAKLQIPCWCLDPSFNITLSPADLSATAAIDVIAAARDRHSKEILSNGDATAGTDLVAFADEYGTVVVKIPTRRHSAIDRNQLVQILENYHVDLIALATDERAIDGFNIQLSQSYEEVNLIFRMSKFLAGSNDPQAAVRTMCDEIRSVLNYGWVSIIFIDCDAVLAPLRGSTACSGRLPCSEEALTTAGNSIAQTVPIKVLEPANNPFAFTCGGEILSARVMHGGTAIGNLLAGNRQGIDQDISSVEIQLVEATVGFLELFHQNAFRFSEQRQQFLGTLHALTAAVDAKDPYTRGHSERVGWLASQLAAQLGLDYETVEAVRVAGLLHDIGKIGVPESILTKPARLTDEEFEVIKRHPVIGHQILSKLPSLGFQLPGVLHHHERWDGNGYPSALKGDAIPQVARMLAFADTFDAMSSNRAYRTAITRSKVLEEIRKASGSQFDPQMVEAFTSLDFTEFDVMLHASGSLKKSEPPMIAAA